MTDWATISALATAGGTLVLAVATFASVRSANRAARVAERALEVRLRPLLVPSRLEDAGEKVSWVDEHRVRLPGGKATFEAVDGNLYLAASLRNVGTGIAVLHGWHPWTAGLSAERPHPPPEQFRRQTRDLYIPPGGIGFWQGAVRDRNDDAYAGLHEVIEQRRRFTIDLLYSDHEGGQRIISRFAFSPLEDPEWLASVSRHFNLDRPDPR